MDLKRLFLSGCLAAAVAAPGPATGGEVSLVPSVEFRQEYDDNLFFDARDETDDFVTILSPGLAVERKTERLDASFSRRSPGRERRTVSIRAACTSPWSSRGRSWRPADETSTRKTWLSVPPETIRYPRAASAAARPRALARICPWYSRNSSVNASLNATAFAATTCMSGPPCIPGKSARLTSFLKRFLHKINPLLGPRSVLCVVVVTKSQCGTGDGCRPAATSPEMWAMSAIRRASTSSAIARKRSKTRVRL